MYNYRQSPATGLGRGASVFPYAPDDSPMSAANIPTTVFDHGSVSMYKRPTVYDHSSIGLLKRKSIISGGSATGASRRKRHRPAASASMVQSASGLQVSSAGLCCRFSTWSLNPTLLPNLEFYTRKFGWNCSKMRETVPKKWQGLTFPKFAVAI